MWEISIWFAIFLFAINGFLVYFADAVTDYELISPFTNTTYVPPDLPNVNDTIANLTTTTTAKNATSGGAVITFWDAANFIFNSGAFFTQFVYGTITGSFLVSMGMPSAFLTILYGTEIFFFMITVLHILTGRF